MLISNSTAFAPLRRHIQQARVKFPRIQIVSLTWNIPENFGGLTNVLLRRTSLIAQLGGFDVPILTLGPQPDVKAKERELREIGMIGKRVHLRNVWVEIAAMNDRQLDRLAISGLPVPQRTHPSPSHIEDSDDKCRPTSFDSTGATLRIDHLRADNTVVVRDERKDPNGHGVILYNTSGKPLCRWDRIRDLYFAWMDAAIGDEETFLINDSAFIGSFLGHYQRPHVRKIQAIHSAHLEPDAPSLYGPVFAAKKEIITDHAQFDALTLLTERQCSELRKAFPAANNTVVIPNSRRVAKSGTQDMRHRNPGSGIILARLSSVKRIDIAIDSLRILKEDRKTTTPTLDIFGTGPDLSRLQNLVSNLNLSNDVKFRGYSHETSNLLNQASFLVLSSKSEGFGLVLVEAMAAGCVPIAFDIRYGPSDIITHGVDGFLVPDGDSSALAATIAEFLEMSEKDRLKMRNAARANARRFGDVTVTQMWAELCHRLIKRPVRPLVAGRFAEVSLIRLSSQDSFSAVILCGRTAGGWASAGADTYLRARTRSGLYGFEVPVRLHDDETFDVSIPLTHFAAQSPEVYDFWLTVAGAQQHRRVSVATGAEIIPPSSTNSQVGRFYKTDQGNLSLAIEPARL